jgi:hypothetical protein
MRGLFVRVFGAVGVFRFSVVQGADIGFVGEHGENGRGLPGPRAQLA